MSVTPEYFSKDLTFDVTINDESTGNKDRALDVFHYQELAKAFYFFMKGEYAKENFDFLLEVNKLIEEDKAGNLDRKRCQEVVDNFINIGATSQINISGDVRNKIFEAMKSKELGFIAPAFEAAAEEVQRLMKLGPWMRFKETEVYRKEMDKVIIEIEAEEKANAEKPSFLSHFRLHKTKKDEGNKQPSPLLSLLSAEKQKSKPE